MARVAGRLINYPTSHLDVGGIPVGVTMILRAVLLGLAGVGMLLLWRRSRSRSLVNAPARPTASLRFGRSAGAYLASSASGRMPVIAARR
ncbi:MAG: hypothetical protein IPQ07_40205 [Myxococcales bacterium]|nr:hypothetical protein [Myxococcales bacterium]